MNKLKRLVAAATLMTMLGSTFCSLEAQEYYYDTGGYGYEESSITTEQAAGIALGTAAIIGIIAVAVRHGHHGHSHGHSH